MDTNKDQFQQQPTGSAEQSNRDRDEQLYPLTDLSDDQRHNIASQIGEKEDSIASISDLGQMSGRDDAAGGTGDRMEDQSSNQETDR